MAELTLPKGTNVPNHIAIILDGNRRWARARGLDASEGHRAGYLATKNITKTCRKFGVHTLTVWGFSTENWDRPVHERENIMKLVRKFLEDFEHECHEEKVRFVHLGRKDRFPKDIISWISRLETETKDYKVHTLNVALDYGGRDEIIRATKRIIEANISAEDINEELFASYLDTADQTYPFPDLFIRPSGEQRTSGLLPWQMTYAEFYWETDHLPDLTPEKLREAILDYSRRRRRFGGNDTVKHLKFKPEVTARLELAWWRLGNIPEGTKFKDYAMKHLQEQWGLSKKLGSEAAVHLVAAILYGKRERWDKANGAMKKFYEVIRNEAKLAFEPTIAASLEIKLLKRANAPVAEVEDTTREYLAEVYRISDLQAAKAAHLRTLATAERRLAESNGQEIHWDNARNYLEKYYEALKERVA